MSLEFLEEVSMILIAQRVNYIADEKLKTCSSSEHLSTHFSPLATALEIAIFNMFLLKTTLQLMLYATNFVMLCVILKLNV